MKKFFVAIIILIALPVFSFYYMSYVNISCEKLEKSIENIEENPTLKALENFEKNWEKLEEKLAFSLNHSELDVLNENITKCINYFKTNKMKDFYTHLSLLKKQLKHISELEKPILKNVF